MLGAEDLALDGEEFSLRRGDADVFEAFGHGVGEGMGYSVVVGTGWGEEMGELEGVDGGPTRVLFDYVGFFSVCCSGGHLVGGCREVEVVKGLVVGIELVRLRQE